MPITRSQAKKISANKNSANKKPKVNNSEEINNNVTDWFKNYSEKLNSILQDDSLMREEKLTLANQFIFINLGLSVSIEDWINIKK
jgi:hypothetical protein